jgi:hypothetical protein
MHPDFRAAFNRAFSPALARGQAAGLARRAGREPGFRLAETPVFLTRELEERLVAASHGILAQLSRPETVARLRRFVPPEWDTPGMDALPSIAQVDLAVTRAADGSPRAEARRAPGLPVPLGLRGAPGRRLGGRPRWDPGPSRRGLEPLLLRPHADLVPRPLPPDRRGGARPRDGRPPRPPPERQKTAVDFDATRRLLGVEAVCATEVEKEGRRLYRRKGGRRVPIERIYNRVVFDELARSGDRLPFDFRDDLAVEWAPHPNWFWAFSKAALPLLDHPAAPRARTLDALAALPSDLESGWVLKPLFSFAGGGVNVEPTGADVAAVPAAERDRWCLQERIDYAPALEAADGGGVKVEIRMMFFRPDAEPSFTLGLNLCRLSRGKMHGVDFNRDFTWVGSSVALRPAGGWPEPDTRGA